MRYNKAMDKRKTYSLSSEMSMKLAQRALDLSHKLKVNITRQSILDALVSNLDKKVVLDLVVKQLKNNDQA